MYCMKLLESAFDFLFSFLFSGVCVKVLAAYPMNSTITTATYLSLITGREMNSYTCLLSSVDVGEQTFRIVLGAAVQ